jgi:hypothetical protein
MFPDLTKRSINADAYSGQPFTFLDQAVQNDLGNVAAIDLIENGRAKRASGGKTDNSQICFGTRKRIPNFGDKKCRRV